MGMERISYVHDFVRTCMKHLMVRSSAGIVNLRVLPSRLVLPVAERSRKT